MRKDWAEITPYLTCVTEAEELFCDRVMEYFRENTGEDVRRSCLEDLDLIARTNGIDEEDFRRETERFRQRLEEQERNEKETGGVLSCFRALEEFPEERAEWLVPGWIPKGQITLLSAAGGAGKTSLWIDLVAAVTKGKPCLMDPAGHQRQPRKALFLTTEDSVSKTLHRKLRLAGADMSGVFTPDFGERPEAVRMLRLGGEGIGEVIRHYRPALCVLDPLQAFLPPEVNMSSRNAMRDCLAPLIALGEETGTAFLIICHTNKRENASGRNRVADSADLWDIARSVLMAGDTQQQGIHYLSNEKNNYAPLQETILFSFDADGIVRPEGHTWKRDREFARETGGWSPSPKKDSCRAWLLEQLESRGGTVPSRVLDELRNAAGFSGATFRRAREALMEEGEVRSREVYRDGQRMWILQRSGTGDPGSASAGDDACGKGQMKGKSLVR